ncbi:DUF559 domain-containing protein [Thermoleophilia bacterium SCSIO 60948]|nr:DUF559 domain-containing protein [Thermoleophilia bacterium SCSIO 60948]
MARRQHGVLSLAQLLEAGLSRRAVEYRCSSGQLVRLHRGVYAVGHRPRRRETTLMAASLAAAGAPLSHRTAAAHWGVLRHQSGVVHLTFAKDIRSRRGMVIHRRPIEPDEITTRDGIPVTDPSRTLLDLAGLLNPQQLWVAFDKAVGAQLDLTPLSELLERYPKRKGISTLRHLAATLRPRRDRIRSSLESRFTRWLADRRLPPPERNQLVEVEGTLIEVDCLWRSERLVVELDGAPHLTQAAVDADKARDRRVRVAGYETFRVSGTMLDREPAAIEADLRRLLARPRSSASARCRASAPRRRRRSAR